MESRNKEMTRVILVVVAVIIVILIAIFLIRRRAEQNLINVNSPLPTPVSTFQENLQNNFGITVPNNATKVDLHDSKGGSQAGLFTFEKQGSIYIYTVIADLEEPQEGYFYQAWLVKDGDSVSLGKLSLAKGGWMTDYSTSVDLSDHKTILITLEKTLGNTPHDKVLEGSF
jgi:hypothetical protein